MSVHSTQHASINLVDDKPDLDKVVVILESTAGQQLLPDKASTQWRDPALDDFYAPLVVLALQEADTPLPEIPDFLYEAFHRSGERLEFENLYFERRRRLARAAIALLRCQNRGPERTALEASLKNKLEAIHQEESWSLPAHVKAHSGKDPLTIDLFSAETANTVAEIMELFGHCMPNELVETLSSRLEREFFENYLNRYSEFWWTSSPNNWNAVCHQGVIGAALTQLEDTALLAKLLVVAGRCLENYIGGFADDGGSSEGPGYWAFGFGKYAQLSAQLEKRTQGQLSLIGESAKYKQIARYGPSMVLPGNKLVNFSDCTPGIVHWPWLLNYLGTRLDEPLCRQLGAQHFRDLLSKGLQPHARHANFGYLKEFMLLHGEQVHSGTSPFNPGDIYLKDLGVIVSHGGGQGGERWHFAAKAGHNGEFHNHNDCGSYILNIGEESIIEEIGAPEYVKAYFQAETRYHFLAARTRGHSLAVINGCEQSAGVEYSTKVVHYRNDAEHMSTSMDLTGAYPEAAGCSRYIRTFRFDKIAPKIEVTEEFELGSTMDLESAIITRCKVQEKQGLCILQGKSHAVVLTPLEGTTIASIESLPFSNHTGHADAVTRISLRAETITPRTAIAYRLEIAP